MQMKLPDILNIPPKLLPVLTDFNKYRYFLIEGGRGSAKTQTIARILLYIAEEVQGLRIACGREIQNTIEDSVYAVLRDLITQYNLAYEVQKSKIRHLVSGSEFIFKGFREQGATNIKGLEGVDILWPDEAQSVTKPTLDMIIPTIRKEKSKLIFTMNRFMYDDAVYEFLAGRPDCLHIHIDYFENPFCPQSIKTEAENLKGKSMREYRHIYLGEPWPHGDDYLFNQEKLMAAYEVQPLGDLVTHQKVVGIDFAAQGNDQCVATLLTRESNVHWKLKERRPWDESDTMVSIGKIVALLGEWKPTVAMIDIGGMGKPVYDRLIELGIKNLYPFDGGATDGIDTDHYGNKRADGYYRLVEWFDMGWLMVDRQKDVEVIKQLEKIKMKPRSNGVRYIQPKVDMKKELRYSPDDADSLMMAVYATKLLGQKSNSLDNESNYAIRRVSGSKRPR